MDEILTGQGEFGFNFGIIMGEQAGAVLYRAKRRSSPKVDLCRTLIYIA